MFTIVHPGVKSILMGHTWVTYKNLSWVWGWDRKICSEDHRLASWCLRSDYNWWSRGMDFFYPILTRIVELFLAHHLIPHLYREKLKKNSRKSCIRWDATWWHHYNITMTSWIDVRLACGCLFFYLSLGLVWVCEIEISHMGKNNGKSKSSHRSNPGVNQFILYNPGVNHYVTHHNSRVTYWVAHVLQRMKAVPLNKPCILVVLYLHFHTYSLFQFEWYDVYAFYCTSFQNIQ